MRDLLRGRLTARYCVRGLIEELELPAGLGEIVARTCRRTRLSLSEQADVARELAQHFQDGLETGKSPEELQREFGDPRQSARLIRRAKIRCRPVAWRIFYSAVWRLCALLSGIVIVVWAVALVRILTATPTLKINLKQEYMAAQADIAEEDRAWPEYRAVLVDLFEDPKARRYFASPRKLTVETRALVDAFLSENRPLMAQLRAATRMPRLGYRIGEPADARKHDLGNGPTPLILSSSEDNPPAYRIGRPTSQLRKLAEILDEDLRWAREAGDGRTVYADATALLRLARHCRDGDPTPFGDIAAIGIVGAVTRSIRETLTLRPELFTDDELIRLAHELAAEDLPLAMDAAKARRVFEDDIQRLYTDDGQENGILTPAALEELQRRVRRWRGPPYEDNGPLWNSLVNAAAVFVADRQETMRMYGELEAAIEARMREPYWRRQPFSLDKELAARNDSIVPWYWRYGPLVSSYSPFYFYEGRNELLIMRRDAAQAALALELYRRRNGEWPVRLSQLVPEMLPGMPVDHFDGRQLRYRRVDGEPRLYSVGRNQVDDGGVMEDEEIAYIHDYPYYKPPGRADDWRLWPLRPRPLLPEQD